MTRLEFGPTAVDKVTEASGAFDGVEEFRDPKGQGGVGQAKRKATAGSRMLTAIAAGTALAPLGVPWTARDDSTAPRPAEIQQDVRDLAREWRNAQRALATRFAAQRDDLHREESDLVAKKFESGLTEEEARRLDYVRWHIHMVEDAELGPSLDALDRLAAINEKLAATIQAIGRQVRRAPVTGRRSRR
jgi:hypothetical protein